MKQIIFIRHAKSDWGNEFLKDVDRPLNETGYADAYALSKWFLENHAQPDLIIASTATRAINTALIFARTLEFNMNCFRVEKEIYESSMEMLISIVKEQDETKQRLMIFGHNPAITNICNALGNDLFFDNIPTCGIVALNFKINKWTDLAMNTGVMDYYRFPKDFKNKD
ncbi:MAG TPA: phosphoglycerate mutase family protein [Bacteroidia bacterium]|nr:phosphoglycerate mutase family protein [Bacteroidia bacterium]